MEKVYNSLANNPRLLVLDSRSVQSYNAGHIKGSFCVTLSSDGKSLQKLAGPPWSSKCWWDRDVLLVTSTPSPSPSQSPSFSKKKKRRLEEKSSDANVVLQFLSKESLVKSLLILGGDDTATTTAENRNGERNRRKNWEISAGDAKASTFSSFAKQYPFFVTKSHKAALVSGYPSEILPQCLYLGDMENAKSKSQLEELKISHVVTIHSECLSFNKPIVCMFFELADEPTANIAQYFEPVYEFIQNVEMKRGRVLVHCGAGASRSATLCAAYLMRTRQWGVDYTLKYLKERRNQVNPNRGFISALHEYQKNLLCLPDKAALNSATQVCSASKAKRSTGSVHEFQLEIQKIAGDSLSIVNWANFVSAINALALSTWMDQTMILRDRCPGTSIIHIFREHNSIADSLSRRGLAAEAGRVFYEIMEGSRATFHGCWTIFAV